MVLDRYTLFRHFCLFAGLTDDIYRLHAALTKDKVKHQLFCYSNEMYGRIQIATDDTDLFMKLVNEFPELEGLICFGRGDVLFTYSGESEIRIVGDVVPLFDHTNIIRMEPVIDFPEESNIGRYGKSKSVFFSNADGPYKRLFFPEDNVIKKVSIDFADGRTVEYGLQNKSIQNVVWDLAYEPITAHSLAELFIDGYTAKIKEKRISDFCLEHPTLDDVTSIRVSDFRIHGEFFKDESVRFKDPSIDRLLFADFTEIIKFTFNLREKKMVETRERIVKIPDSECEGIIYKTFRLSFDTADAMDIVGIPSSLFDIDSGSRIVLSDNGVLEDYFTANKSIMLPMGVRRIAGNAFASSGKNLKEIVLNPTLKVMSPNAFDTCKSLRRLVLPRGLTIRAFNKKVLAKSKIKEIKLSDGTLIKIRDPYMYDCFIKNKGEEISFSYEFCAKDIMRAISPKSRYQVAIDLLRNHRDELGEYTSNVMDAAVRYVIGVKDVPGLKELLDMNINCSLNIEELAKTAARLKSPEIESMILAIGGGLGSIKNKSVVVTETPAERARVTYIMVAFENGTRASYFCAFKVKPGDRVSVYGSKKDLRGEVILIHSRKDFPKGKKAKYTTFVKEAFNVHSEEVNIEEGLGDL